ncbi:MAG: hypothetical protein EA389_00065 [Ilumatobacter sp.]|nr:MAG: hypothetical protein EA389_00065 [Ilumatobacter sp.]
MKKKIITTAVALGLGLATFGGAVDAGGPPAGAGDRGKPVGVACMQHGLGLLRSLGAPAQVSRDVVGLPLNTVLALHRNDPQEAAGVLVSLGLPAGPCDISG